MKKHGADVALGFDGDGDRCGVVDDEGEEIFADKVGLMLARDLSAHAQERDLRRRREIDRPLRDRSGAEGQRRQGRLLEDRPFLHQAPHHRTRRARRLRKDRPLLLPRAARATATTTASSPPPPCWRCSTAIRARSSRDLRKALPKSFTSLTMSPHCDDEKKYGIVDRVVADYQKLAPTAARSSAAAFAT